MQTRSEGDRYDPSAPRRARGPADAGRGRSAGHYRLEDGVRAIDIKVPDVGHLFSGLDPSPTGFRDLDIDVEEYIIDAVEEIGAPRKAKVVFHLPEDQLAAADANALTEAVHNFFVYRAWATRRRLRRMMRAGYVSLVIGLLFLFACLALRHALLPQPAGTVSEILAEGLLIFGWVGMWKPIEILLYDWWPLWQELRRYRGLTDIIVDWRGQDGVTSASRSPVPEPRG